jgi:hypothetical protein
MAKRVLIENYRMFIKEQAPVSGGKTPDKLLALITTQFKAGAEQIAPEVNKKAVANQPVDGAVEESAFLIAAGMTIAIPRILSLISKMAKGLGAAFAVEMKNENFLDRLAHDIHHQYIAAIKLALKVFGPFRRLPPEKQNKGAEAVLNGIIATLMLTSIAGAASAAVHGQAAHAALEGALVAVKQGELAQYLEKAFS